MAKQTTWIALLRSINVGGNNILPMADLKRELSNLKFENVRTYIQSGNVVFESTSSSPSALAKKMTQRINEIFGFKPHLFVLSLCELQRAITENPYPDAVSNPSTLHLSFLAQPAVNADIAALKALGISSERFTLTDSVFYLHAPDGIGRSKLAAKAEKLLGVTTTSRNYRTVDKLLSMAT